MMTNEGERRAKAYLDAIQQLAHPHQTVLGEPSPIAVLGGGQEIDAVTLAAMAQAAGQIDADLLYVEFQPGAEMDGPRNVVAVFPRAGVCHLKPECRFWLSDKGELFLIPRFGSGWSSFNADGMDYQRRKFSGSLQPGFDRAAAKLRMLATAILLNGQKEDNSLAA